MSNSTGILALFPGQGSQKVGMGEDLAAQSDIAKQYFARADKALGFPLSALCFRGPVERLTATEVAQPAILTVSTICFELAKAKLGSALRVVAAAGHSLGEYSALVAAGAIAFEDAIVLVHKRGKYMQSAVPAGLGKMIAVLGKEVDEIEAIFPKITQGPVEIANINAPGQIVVSGRREGVDEFIKLLGPAKVIELQVSAPFHCSLMAPAAALLERDLEQTVIRSAAFPVYANVLAKPLREPAEIRDALKRQVCGRVRWVESIENAVAEQNPSHGVEFGSGNVLSGLLKRINSEIPRVECGSLEAIEKLIP